VNAPRHPEHDEIVTSAHALMDALELGEMKVVADRQMDALEAVTGILRGVVDTDAQEWASDYGRGYIEGQRKLARQLLEAIVRVVKA
jgi:hypothetical protein